MDDAARQLRNKYHREWYKRNRDKVREYNRRYWEKRATEANKTRKPAKTCIET